jgi:hypothetical protein
MKKELMRYVTCKYIPAGLLFTGWGSSLSFKFGGKMHGIFAKGEEKTLYKFNFLGIAA